MPAAAAACLSLVVAWAARPSAHDIPNDVTVQALIRPQGQTLHVIVRVPLNAMRDMDFPKVPGRNNADLFDLSRAEQTLRDASTLWISDYVDVYEGDRQLPPPRVVSVRAALQSDRSFASYDEALAHLNAPPLAADMEFFWSQGLLDILFEYPIHSDQSRFSINPRLARLGLRTLTVLRFLPPGGAVRGFEFLGDPGLVQLDPTWGQTLGKFAALGFDQLLDGPGYLLFLVCLVMPFRRLRPLVAVVTAFTAASSITLIASAYNLAPDALWFQPLVDTLIALSVVYMAAENVIAPRLERRWIVTFAFGLAHGFGFGFALRPSLQLAGTHFVTSVLSFNLGVELAQVAILAVLVPALSVLFRFVVTEWLGTAILSALAAHTAWHWLDDRVDLLRKCRFTWPPIDATFVVGLLRWAMVAVVAAGCYWLVFGLTASRSSKP